MRKPVPGPAAQVAPNAATRPCPRLSVRARSIFPRASGPTGRRGLVSPQSRPARERSPRSPRPRSRRRGWRPPDVRAPPLCIARAPCGAGNARRPRGGPRRAPPRRDRTNVGAPATFSAGVHQAPRTRDPGVMRRSRARPDARDGMPAAQARRHDRRVVLEDRRAIGFGPRSAANRAVGRVAAPAHDCGVRSTAIPPAGRLASRGSARSASSDAPFPPNGRAGGGVLARAPWWPSQVIARCKG